VDRVSGENVRGAEACNSMVCMLSFSVHKIRSTQSFCGEV
jgi:hypothetical protein